MNSEKVDGSKLKQAINEFGSLEKALQDLKGEAATLKKRNQQLVQENAELTMTRQKAITDVKILDGKLKEKRVEIASLSEKIKHHGRQFDLFGSLMAMIADSPSVTDSLKVLIDSLQELPDPGWHVRNSPGEMRSLFVRTLLGDYLRCYRCDACGASFIVNREPRYKAYSHGYQCPACHLSYGVHGNDSFLKAMVSEEQMENTLRVKEVLQDNEVLAPLRLFLEVPCEFCDQPITQWDERNVKLAAGGIGWGHTSCWNTSHGQTMEFLSAVKAVQEKQK